MKNIIEIEDLTMAYADLPVLLDIDLKIKEGSRTAIIGPNGAGKSTLIKGILGLQKTLSGKIKIFNNDLKNVRKKVAYVPQQNSVKWDFPITVLDVVVMGRYVHLGWIKRPKAKDYNLAKQALQSIGMLEYKNRQISELSGGQRQRVFIARALCQDADLYFMDEPLAGVDIPTENLIMQTLHQFQALGKTSIIVHHDLHTVKKYFDNVIMLNKSIIASGPVEEVFTEENLRKTYGSDSRIKTIIEGGNY